MLTYLTLGLIWVILLLLGSFIYGCTKAKNGDITEIDTSNSLEEKSKPETIFIFFGNLLLWPIVFLSLIITLVNKRRN